MRDISRAFRSDKHQDDLSDMPKQNASTRAERTLNLVESSPPRRRYLTVVKGKQSIDHNKDKSIIFFIR
jgi:hypothetical protein